MYDDKLQIRLKFLFPHRQLILAFEKQLKSNHLFAQNFKYARMTTRPITGTYIHEESQVYCCRNACSLSSPKVIILCAMYKAHMKDQNIIYRNAWRHSPLMSSKMLVERAPRAQPGPWDGDDL